MSTTPSVPVAKPESFLNRTVIITGGAGTIGRPLSIAFARAGANVVINDLGTSPHHQTHSVNTSQAEELAAQLTEEGFSAIASTHDITTSPAAIPYLAIEKFGRIDVIINCVGIHPYSPFAFQDIDVSSKVFRTNVIGPMQVTRAAWPHFISQSYGRVINFTSDSLFGMKNSAAYVASKGAVLGLTNALAMEGSENGIKVNACAPVAYPPMVMDAFEVLPEAQRDWFRQTFTAESNVPMIMALASENCPGNGETWEIGAWGMGRMILGTTQGVGRLKTMEECLEKMAESTKTETAANANIFQPKDVEDFLSFKSSYI